MLKLFCFPRSGNSREVKLVLEEKKIPYEKINIRAEGFDREHPEFKKASPRGTVPAIINGDVYMSEALDINYYLEQEYPQSPLLPKEQERRSEIREWVKTFDRKLCLKIGFLIIETLLKPKPEQKEETKVKLWGEILSGMDEADRFLEGKEYFFGAYGLADVSLTPHLAALHRVSKEIPSEFVNLKAWLDRIRLRSSFTATQE